MSDLLLFLQVIFAIVFWRSANTAFENGNDSVGWLYIVISAANAAAAAATVF
jgi:hypothetical protein